MNSDEVGTWACNNQQKPWPPGACAPGGPTRGLLSGGRVLLANVRAWAGVVRAWAGVVRAWAGVVRAWAGVRAPESD